MTDLAALSRLSILFLIVTRPALVASANPKNYVQGNSVSSSPDCPDNVPSAGKYENDYFGFSIVIPKNLEGLWNSARCSGGPDDCACMSDHGRIIPLGADSKSSRFIEAFAATNSEPDTTLAMEVNDHLKWIKKRSLTHTVTILRRSNMRVGRRAGRRVVARYFDKNEKGWFIEDFVEVLRQGVGYSLYLRTRESNYKKDLRIFNEVVASFALTGGSLIREENDQ
jgi:hypothetical protein